MTKCATPTAEPSVHAFDVEREYFFPEGCYIVEVLNDPAHPDVSIARARVSPGVSTRPHSLIDTTERYLVQSGEGLVFLGADTEGQPVRAGDVVVIPAGVCQSIRNTGGDDLVFHAICTPRFMPECYREE
jgi:mannose-6-phosphate isomerase-like protein (cupin superfamily)